MYLLGSPGLRLPDSLLDQCDHFTFRTASALLVLPQHDHVEELRGDPSDIDHVTVASVPSGADHTDAPAPLYVVTLGEAVEVGVEELPERGQTMSVVRVIDEGVHAMDVDVVQPTRCGIPRRQESGESGPDVVQMCTLGEGSRGRGHRVHDVEAGLAVVGGRQPVAVGQPHRAPALPQADVFTPVVTVQHHGRSASPAVRFGTFAALRPRRAHAHPDHLTLAPAAHPGHQFVVGIEHRIAVARDGLDHHGLHVRELLQGVDAAQTEVVGRDVGDHRDIVAVIPQTLPQDAAAGHLQHSEVDAGILQDHAGALGP